MVEISDGLLMVILIDVAHAHVIEMHSVALIQLQTFFEHQLGFGIPPVVHQYPCSAVVCLRHILVYLNHPSKSIKGLFKLPCLILKLPVLH